MPTENHNPENDESEVRALFDLKTYVLLLPEHTETETPDEDFLAFGTTYDDLQF